MGFRTLVILASLIFASTAHAQSTAFTYQGSLKNGSVAATGVHDFRFRLFDAATAGNQVGTQQCIDNLSIAEGVFTATLDFGQQFASTVSRFVEIEVRQDTGLTCANAGGFVVLSPRQPVSAAPLANHAKSAFALDSANGSVPNAVFVDNAGKVGVGTLAPTHSVHIANPAPTLAIQDTDSTTQQVGYVTYRDSGKVERAWVGYGTAGSPHFSVVNARSGGNLAFWAGIPTRRRALPPPSAGSQSTAAFPAARCRGVSRPCAMTSLSAATALPSRSRNPPTSVARRTWRVPPAPP